MLHKVKNDKQIIITAYKKRPSLIIDCSRSANPHKLFGIADTHELRDIFIVEVEMLYKYRDVIKNLEFFVKELNVKTVLITNSKHLFDYGNEIENKKIHEYCNKKILLLSKKIAVIIVKNI